MARKLIIVVAATLALAGCAKREPAPPAPAQVLRVSQRNEPADLDPATSALPDEFFIIRAVGEGLLRPDPAGGAPQPAAADRWEVSRDGLTYTFHLRTDAAWSNGEPVTAPDFVESYRRLLTPATAAPKAPLFFMVKNARAFATGATADFSTVGFAAPDARTLVITLARPMPQFPVYAASGPWIPANPRVIARFGRDWTRPANHVGNGPFTLAEWRPHQRIVVRKNPRYHGAATVRLDEIQFLVFDSGDTEERAYRGGQVDVTMAVPFAKLDTYARVRPGELHRAALAETRYLAFNTTRPPLDDVRVRQALSLALDRAQLVERVVRGGQEPAYRLVPPALRAASDRARLLNGAIREDAATARQLLADAGFAGGRNFPALELSTWVGSPVIEAVQAMWKKELGLDIAIVTREAKVHLAALREGRYDIGFMTEIPDVADAANLLGDFTTGSPTNYPHWSDSAYDALIARAALASDAAAQAALLREAEARLLGQSPLAPLYFNTRNWLMRPAVQDWQEDAVWARDYSAIRIAPP